jgi:glycosyltransferase involved in cell wall biosynthesis
MKANVSSHNIVLIQTDTPGVSNARNEGLDVAGGNYITFIDDDDFVSENYLDSLLNLASKEIISVSNTKAFTEKGDNEIYIYPSYRVQKHYEDRSRFGLQSYIKAECFSGPCMKLFHKDMIGKRRFNVTFSNHEDSLFLFEISDCFKDVAFTTPNVVYYRNIRMGSATTSYPLSKKIPNCLRLIVAYTRLYLKNPRGYSFRFYFSCIIGALKIIIVSVCSK